MKQPTNIQKGFLFDYKWIPTLRDLEPRDFYIIFWQLLDFQQSNGSKKIPRHRGRRDLDHIANLIVPQIENRLNGAMGGRPIRRPSPHEGGSNPGSNPPSIPPSEGGLGAKISQDKISQDKSSQGKVSQAETGEPFPSEAPCGSHTAHGGTHTQETEAEPVREGMQAYGEYGNVYLTPAQYKTLTEDEGIPPAYVDRYSLRLARGNYHPADHAATLRAWWREDREAFTARPSGGYSGGRIAPDTHTAAGESSFDVDTFFEDAVRRSLGE